MFISRKRFEQEMDNAFNMGRRSLGGMVEHLTKQAIDMESIIENKERIIKRQTAASIQIENIIDSYFNSKDKFILLTDLEKIKKLAMLQKEGE